MKTFRLIALAGALALGVAVPAQANIIIALNSVTGPVAGQFTWSYEGSLQAGAETTETSNNPNFPTFFTLYDVGGLVSGSETQPLGWTATEQLVGVTPSGISPTDSASVVNITWTYTGSQVTGPVDFGAFTFKSTEGNNGLFINFSQQDTKDNPGQLDDDTRLSGFGSIVGPSASQVPEPLTLSIFGAGLAGAAALRRRKARRS